MSWFINEHMIFFLMYIDSMFLKGEISEGIPARRAALPTKKAQT